ncbi:MAG TPA: hypothetical protein VGR25_05940 [bacterium]|nr:hypothetical protein [bacterium]
MDEPAAPAAGGRSHFGHGAGRKLVGQLQFVYLPLLLARSFWLSAGWAPQTVDHLMFAVLAVAIGVNTIDYGRSVRRLLAAPPRRASAARS